MNEPEVIEKLIDELDVAKDSSWQQGGYKQFVFRIFKESPKNEAGFPALLGDNIRARVCQTLGQDSTEYRAIERTLDEVCDAWREWKYALENWDHS